MLELYQAGGCSHSQKVRAPLTDLGVSSVLHNPRLPGTQGGDVLNEQTYPEMTELGGQDQIPYLVDSAREGARYESDDIVEYVREITRSLEKIGRHSDPRPGSVYSGGIRESWTHCAVVRWPNSACYCQSIYVYVDR